MTLRTWGMERMSPPARSWRSGAKASSCSSAMRLKRPEVSHIEVTPKRADGRGDLIEGEGAGRRDGEAAAIEEGSPDFQGGGVEGGGGELEEGLVGVRVT